MSLATKLIVRFLLLSIVPLAIFSFLAFENSRQALEQATVDHLTAVTPLKAEAFEEWLNANVQRLQGLAQRPSLRDLAPVLAARAQTAPEFDTARTALLAEHLDYIVEQEGGFLDFFLLRVSDGMILVSTDEALEGRYRESEPFFLEGQRRTYIQNVYYSLVREAPAMTISTPVMDQDGRVVAVLAGDMDLAELGEIMARGSDLYATEETYLVNTFNFFVSESRFEAGAILSRSVHTTGAVDCLAHHDSTGYYDNYRGIPVIGTYRWLAPWELCILTEVEQAEVLASIDTLRNIVWSIGVVVALFAAAVGLWFARTLTRPFEKLVAGAEAIGKGNFDYRIGLVSTSVEVGRLARAFDQMVENIQAITVSRDALAQEVTERQKAQEQQRKLMAELDRSNTELEQFAYVASHDLQEPLRVVVSYLQLLERRYQGQLGEDADKFISRAVGAANRMKGLINDLLTYSRVTRRGNPFKATDLGNVLDGVLANLQVAIAESEAIITHDPLPVVRADAAQMAQLMQNLIGNAIKFRGDEPPAIHVGAQSQDNTWVVSVLDNGIGIDPEYAERIFVIFQRLHTRQEYEGTGIGLAVCKRIVERHDGRIWAESQPGQGSVFYFTLPNRGENMP